MSDTYQVCESCTHRFAVPIGARASKCETCAALDRKDAEITRLHAEAAELRAQLESLKWKPEDGKCSPDSVTEWLPEFVAGGKADAALTACGLRTDTLRDMLKRAANTMKAEKESRVFYQGLVYKACNAVDDGLGRCVGTGGGTTDVAMPEGVWELAKKVHDTRAQLARVEGERDALLGVRITISTPHDVCDGDVTLTIGESIKQYGHESLAWTDDWAAEVKRLREKVIIEADSGAGEYARAEHIAKERDSAKAEVERVRGLLALAANVIDAAATEWDAAPQSRSPASYWRDEAKALLAIAPTPPAQQRTGDAAKGGA